MDAFQTLRGVNAIYGVSINPFPPNADVVVTGNNTFRYYNLSNGLQQLRQEITAKENQGSTHYTCHAWAAGKLYVCTNQGDILQLDSKTCKGRMDCSPNDRKAIEHIVVCGKRIITGGEDNQLYFYTLESEGSKSVCERINTEAITISSQLDVGNARIRSLAVSRNFQWLVISLDNNQIIKADLSPQNVEHIKFEYLHYNAHSAAINGLDVCIKKQLIVTSSTDKSVRIWDYEKKSLEVCQSFTEEAHGVAFHPSGFHIVVGFTDKLRFMNIIDKKLVAYKEIALKSCKEIRFCNGGHMVAAASGNTIHIFNFYTGECPQSSVFKGQETNITSIHWTADDTGFLSANWSGVIERGKLSAGSSEVLYSLKGTKINSVIEVLGKERLVYAATSDKQVRAFKEKTLLSIMDTGAVLGNLMITRNQNYVFAGVEEKQKPGPLRVYSYPFKGDFAEVEAHSAEVKRIKLSYNDKYLFSAGADGCLFIYEVKDPKPKKGEDIRIVFSSEILFSRKDLEGKYKEKEKLDEENEEKRLENERQQQEQKRLKLGELERQEEQLRKEVEIGDTNLKTLDDEKEKTIKAYDENLEKVMAEHDQSKVEEAQRHKEKMEEEDNRMAELEKAVKIQSEDHKKEMEAIKSKYDAMKKDLEEEYNRERSKLKELDVSLGSEIHTAESEYLGRRTSMEADTWLKLDKEAVKNYTEMDHVTRDKATAKAQLNNTSKDKTKKELEIQNLEHDKTTKANELKAKQNANQELKRERLNIEKDIEDREETIKQKKQRVEELRKKEQELEKFKFVLDYKMRELKGEMEPKKREIEKLHEQEMKMDEEVRHFTMANQNMHLIVYDLLARQQGMTKELETQRTNEQQDEQFKTQFSEDISDLCKALKASDVKLLKSKIIEYHKKYLKDAKKKIGTQAENQEAHASKRKYYEDKIQALEVKTFAERVNHTNDNAKLMKENEKLLLQYNELLRDLHLRRLTKTKEGFSSQLSPKAGTGRTRTAGGDQRKELDIQHEEIERLSRELEAIEEENARLRSAKGLPQVLPPLEAQPQPEPVEDQPEEFPQEPVAPAEKQVEEAKKSSP